MIHDNTAIKTLSIGAHKSWDEVQTAVNSLADQLRATAQVMDRTFTHILAIGRGGMIPAAMLRFTLGESLSGLCGILTRYIRRFNNRTRIGAPDVTEPTPPDHPF